MKQITDKDEFLKSVEQLFDMVPLFMLMREIVEDERLNHVAMPKEAADKTLKTFKAVALRQTGSFLLQIGQLANAFSDFSSNPLISLLISNDCRYLLLAIEPIRRLAEQLQADDNSGDDTRELSDKIISAKKMIAEKTEKLKANSTTTFP
jgi:hypothetical protein